MPCIPPDQMAAGGVCSVPEQSGGQPITTQHYNNVLYSADQMAWGGLCSVPEQGSRQPIQTQDYNNALYQMAAGGVCSVPEQSGSQPLVVGVHPPGRPHHPRHRDRGWSAQAGGGLTGEI